MLISGMPPAPHTVPTQGKPFPSPKVPPCLLQALTMVRSSTVTDDACRVALAALSCRDLTSARSCFTPVKPSLNVTVSWSSMPVLYKGGKHPAPRAQDYQASEHQHGSEEEVSCKLTSGCDKKQWQMMQPCHKHHGNTLYELQIGSCGMMQTRGAACMAHLLLLCGMTEEAQRRAVKENSSRVLSMEP